MFIRLEAEKATYVDLKAIENMIYIFYCGTERQVDIKQKLFIKCV